VLSSFADEQVREPDSTIKPQPICKGHSGICGRRWILRGAYWWPRPSWHWVKLGLPQAITPRRVDSNDVQRPFFIATTT
jgi:hypothetical protein